LSSGAYPISSAVTNRNPRESTPGQKTIFSLALSVTTPDDMVSIVKTTIDIDESLLTRAKQVAATEDVTLRELVEDGLRHVLEKREQRASFRLRRATFRGQGLQPDAAVGSWDRLRDLAYKSRGT
jgi:Arc/MetJ family transcription regulator